MGGCIGDIMIIDCNSLTWDEYIEKMPIEKQDIYFSRQYYLMEEEQEKGQGKLFVYEEIDGKLGLYPFILRKIDSEFLETDYYDIETAYGYGGPMLNSTDDSFAQRFEDAFLKFCEESNIVAEFIRFHPLLQNQSIFKKNISVLENRTTVWLDLEKSEEDIWMQDVSTQNRNTIRKCIKNGLTVEKSRDYLEFIKIYNATMDKVGAGDFYYFDNQYYKKISECDKYTLLKVVYQEETIAAAIFIEYGEYFHYHLAGSKKEYLKLAPNNILLWEAIKLGKKLGCKKMHFGGGLSNSEEDNLYRFKKKYSSTTSKFYIGKRVHNKEVYDRLIKNWEEKHSSKATMLLQYRE